MGQQSVAQEGRRATRARCCPEQCPYLPTCPSRSFYCPPGRATVRRSADAYRLPFRGERQARCSIANSAANHHPVRPRDAFGPDDDPQTWLRCSRRSRSRTHTRVAEFGPGERRVGVTHIGASSRSARPAAGCCWGRRHTRAITTTCPCTTTVLHPAGGALGMVVLPPRAIGDEEGLAASVGGRPQGPPGSRTLTVRQLAASTGRESGRQAVGSPAPAADAASPISGRRRAMPPTIASPMPSSPT